MGTKLVVRSEPYVGVDVHELELSADRKVSPWGKQQGSGKFSVLVENAFGLPAGLDWSCLDATDECVSCYALNIELRWKPSAAKMRRNWYALQACGDDVQAMAALLRRLIEQFKVQALKRGMLPWQLVFRIHWDGDFYSSAYAQAWRIVVDENPDVTFWVYTRAWRSLGDAVVAALVGASNMAVYLSVDQYNVDAAAGVIARFPQVHVAALGATYADAQALLDTLGRGRAPRCPENAQKMPLTVTVDRRRAPDAGEYGQGACVACGLCVYGRKDVLFSLSKR